MGDSFMMTIENVDHIGIRITEKNTALEFYKILGFELEHEVDFDAVIILKNKNGVELNLINNGKDISNGKKYIIAAI
mgnify:CR=1 FL=1